jgi:hypothetical protein
MSMDKKQLNNKFHHYLCMVVFGCDDEGQIEFPDTHQEYISIMKAKGVIFDALSLTKIEVGYSSGTGWYFLNGHSPIESHISYDLLMRVIELMVLNKEV